MMLVSRYGNRESFLVAFNPSYQRKLCDSQKLCFLGDYPTLATIKAGYGENTGVMWLLPQLFDLSEYCGCRDKLTEEQIEGCAFVIATEYFFLKISELMLFFHRFKSGRYGHFYGSVDPLVITTALRKFITERNESLARYEQQQREQAEAEYRKAHPPMTYEQWKQRKEAGQ